MIHKFSMQKIGTRNVNLGKDLMILNHILLRIPFEIERHFFSLTIWDVQ